MSAGKPGIGDSGGALVRVEPPARARDAWNPRRSVVARLLWTFVPMAIVPAAVYWFAADRIGREQQQGVRATLLRDARFAEEQALTDEAAYRLDLIADAKRDVAGIARRAAEDARRALEDGPDPNLPAEHLLDDAAGPLRSVGAGVSSAMVSRATGFTARARRDLAATRRVEAPFVILGVASPAVSALSVRTASGVLRVVPGLDLNPGGTPVVDPAFGFPSESARPLVEHSGGIGASDVAWSDVYEDTYAGNGSHVSAVALVKGRDGRLLGEVGVDWAFPRMFRDSEDHNKPEDVEFVFPARGPGVIVAGSRRIDPGEIRKIGAAVSKLGDGVVETSIEGQAFLLVARHVPDLRWTYAEITPREAFEKRVAGQIDPVFAAAQRKGKELRVLYLALVGVFAAVVAIAMRRALTPLLRVARVADALTFRQAAPRLPEAGRLDEVGRLYRALTDLERRVRWRMASMEGVHRLAQTAALMTQPDETLAQLARQIAQLVGAKKAWLALWDPETRSLVGAPPGFGIPEDALRGVHIGLEDTGLTMTVYRTGETILRNDTGDPRLSRPLLDRLGVRENLVFAPLKAELGILGVLGVADKPGGFDGEDQAAIEGYADQAALLLRNARLYEELQKSYERLRDAQRNRDYFLQNVNHELRTPLTAILGWSEVLTEDRPDKETVRIAIDQINRSAQFLLALISDLLDLSRFEEGRTRLEPEEVDLGQLVAGAVEPVSVMADAKGISMSVEGPPARTLVRLDPMRMRQVLWNLVHNAVKFTPKSGRIRVEASADDESVVFSVVDNGVGVDAKDLPFIFERFRQVDGSATRAYRGMGIGLALAKAYVELHGGRITVESQAGKGTAFHVRIPRSASPGDSGDARGVT